MNLEDDKATIRKYLESRGAILWGRAFDINSADGLEQAVNFIQTLMYDLNDAYYDVYSKA